MAQRSNYWSCSEFADWLRGTTKLKAGTSEEWTEWEKRAKADFPVRWWLAEEGLDKVQNFLWWPVDKLYDVKYYINNRWITRTHGLTAHPRDIKPGAWQDVGNRFLPCLFNELVNFVEVELAWWHLAWNPEERHKYNMPWWAVGWWRIRTWRCPQAGLDNLDWQRKLTYEEEECRHDSDLIGKPTPQATKAEEILTLYKWWTEVYPNRPDPYEVSGWSAICEGRRAKNGGSLSIFDNKHENAEEKQATLRALDFCHEIEKKYNKEDEDMMIRLIRVRDALWT